MPSYIPLATNVTPTQSLFAPLGSGGGSTSTISTFNTLAASSFIVSSINGVIPNEMPANPQVSTLVGLNGTIDFYQTVTDQPGPNTVITVGQSHTSTAIWSNLYCSEDITAYSFGGGEITMAQLVSSVKGPGP